MLPINRADLFRTAHDETPPALHNDDLHTLVQGLVDSLTSRLNHPEPNLASLSAFTGNTLRKSVAGIRDKERWDLIGEPCPTELSQLDAILADLHAVLAELAWGSLTPSAVVSTARAGANSRALLRVADLARAKATARSTERISRIKLAAQAAGFDVRVWTRPLAHADAVHWPPVEVAVGVRRANITEWVDALARLSEVMEHDPGSNGGRPPVLMVPVVAGRPVRLLARQLQTTIWPGLDLYDSWAEHAEHLGPPHTTPLTDAALEAHKALQALSGLAALSARREDMSDHQSYADREIVRYRSALQTIDEMKNDDAVVAEVADFLTSLGHRIQNELDQPTDAQDTLAACIARGATLAVSDDFKTVDGLLTVSLQWDLDPAAAARILTSTTAQQT
jgi:hypothetical protein